MKVIREVREEGPKHPKIYWALKMALISLALLLLVIVEVLIHQI